MINCYKLSILHRFDDIWGRKFKWDSCVNGENLGVLGVWNPKTWIINFLTPKRHILRPDHVVWAINRVDRMSRLTCARGEETKKRGGEKSQNRYISPPRGGAPAQRTIMNVVPICWSHRRSSKFENPKLIDTRVLVLWEVKVHLLLCIFKWPIQHCSNALLRVISV